MEFAASEIENKNAYIRVSHWLFYSYFKHRTVSRLFPRKKNHADGCLDADAWREAISRPSSFLCLGESVGLKLIQGPGTQLVDERKRTVAVFLAGIRIACNKWRMLPLAFRVDHWHISTLKCITSCFSDGCALHVIIITALNNCVCLAGNLLAAW